MVGELWSLAMHWDNCSNLRKLLRYFISWSYCCKYTQWSLYLSV